MLNEFFPTPPRLISRMLADIKFSEITTVLEPSAGKGDLAGRIANRLGCARRNSHRYRDDDEKGAIDCIASGITIDNHESDLYVKDSPETRVLLAKHSLSGVQARPFRSNTDGGMW